MTLNAYEQAAVRAGLHRIRGLREAPRSWWRTISLLAGKPIAVGMATDLGYNAGAREQTYGLAFRVNGSRMILLSEMASAYVQAEHLLHELLHHDLDEYDQMLGFSIRTGGRIVGIDGGGQTHNHREREERTVRQLVDKTMPIWIGLHRKRFAGRSRSGSFDLVHPAHMAKARRYTGRQQVLEEMVGLLPDVLAMGGRLRRNRRRRH